MAKKTHTETIFQTAQLYIRRAQTDAPNYRPATEKEERCATCQHFDGQRDALYDFAADPEYICDSYKMREPEIEYRSLINVYKALVEKYGARNSRVDIVDIQAAHDLTVRLGATCMGAEE